MTTADPLNVENLTELVVSARNLADTFRRYGTTEMADRMVCGEAEAVADVLRTVDPALADQWIEGHAFGDEDPDDTHHAQWHELTEATLPCHDAEALPSPNES